MKKQTSGSGTTMAMCHSNYADSVPTAIIAKVLEKPEPGSSCPVTRSPSPLPQDSDFVAGTGNSDLNCRASYKTSDLYCSDTALYCPERWQDSERRQSVDFHRTSLLQLHAQNSTDSNPDEEAYHSAGFSHESPSAFHQQDEFGTGSLRASSTYSSFSLASDDKGGVGGSCGRTTGGNLSSSHQCLYMDWRDEGCADNGNKNISYNKESLNFPKSLSIQHMVPPRSPQKSTSPAYTRTASSFSESYQSSTPRLSSSRSMGSTTGLSQAHRGIPERPSDNQVPEDDLSSRWRQLSVEDINTFSSSYRDITGRVSPYSFSECHFAMAPSRKVKGSLYSSLQEGDDVFHSHMLDQCFVGSISPGHISKPLEHRKQEPTSMLYQAKNNSQDSECSLFLSGSSKEKDSGGIATVAGDSMRDYVNLSVDSSAESLHQSSLEASSLQHYPSPRPAVRPRPSSSSALTIGPALPKKTSARYQKFGSTGLTRKDSLTKAQLYGTLLN